jgi:hypothetical protein
MSILCRGLMVPMMGALVCCLSHCTGQSSSDSSGSNRVGYVSPPQAAVLLPSLSEIQTETMTSEAMMPTMVVTSSLTETQTEAPSPLAGTLFLSYWIQGLELVNTMYFLTTGGASAASLVTPTVGTFLASLFPAGTSSFGGVGCSTLYTLLSAEVSQATAWQASTSNFQTCYKQFQTEYPTLAACWVKSNALWGSLQKNMSTLLSQLTLAATNTTNSCSTFFQQNPDLNFTRLELQTLLLSSLSQAVVSASGTDVNYTINTGAAQLNSNNVTASNCTGQQPPNMQLAWFGCIQGSTDTETQTGG